MDVFRSFASIFTDTVSAIVDGANEVFRNFNPRKRARSLSASPGTNTVNPFEDGFTDPPLFQQAPAAVVEDDLQPQSKRRRTSFPPEEATFSLPISTSPIPITQSEGPFAFHRSSTGLQDALDAPTPPALAFTSRSHSRIADHHYSGHFAPISSSPTNTPTYIRSDVALRPFSMSNSSQWSGPSSTFRPFVFRPHNSRLSHERPIRGVCSLVGPPSNSRPVSTKRQFSRYDSGSSQRRDSSSPRNGLATTLSRRPSTVDRHFHKSSRVTKSFSGARVESEHSQANDSIQPKPLLQAEALQRQSQHLAAPAFADLVTRGVQLGVKESDSADDNISEELRRNEERFTQNMSRSKMRSSELRLELFVCSQQRLQDIKRREEAQRVLHGEDEAWRDEVVDIVEKPPQDASHWDEVYWRDVDGTACDWDEDDDYDAVKEKSEKVTVQESGENYAASAYAPLTRAALKRLRHTFSDENNRGEKLANINGCVITGGDLRLLKPNCWLNDEIVNAYTELVSKRSQESSQATSNGEILANGAGPYAVPPKPGASLPKVKIMNSFFYSKLVEFDRRQRTSVYNYQRVRRWTRRFDVFSYDIMLIPINQQNLHWTLGVIDFKNKTVKHLDSMGTGGSPKVREHLLTWLADEAKDKGKQFNRDEWDGVTCTVPVQGNTDDCGVFLCKFADFISRGWSSFTFTQNHMNYFRSRIAHELLMEKAT